MTNLTPADAGILAAALDDALGLRMGDDDTIDYVATALLGEITDDRDLAWSIAYDAFYKRVRG